ncbi:hypothetical protein JXA47_11925 [Candidatus Sumerlaeota bacterium]|nr:hypothetical protein [Candidatus Sumerlaeota bacterium]
MPSTLPAFQHSLTTAIAMLVITMLLFVAVIASKWRKVPPNKVMIKHVGTRRMFVKRGGTIEIPIIGDCQYLDLSPITVPIIDDSGFGLRPSVTVCIDSESDESLGRAADRLADLDSEDLRRLVTDLVEQSKYDIGLRAEDVHPADAFDASLRARLAELGMRMIGD